MFVYTLVGMRGTGKTTFCKDTFLYKFPNILVYDINNEYGNLPEYKNETSGRFKVLPTTDYYDFCKMVLTLKNFCIISEDCTAYLKGNQQIDAFKKIIVGCRHTRLTMVLLFHSFADVQLFVSRMTNFYVIFKTNDLATNVYKRSSSEKVLKVWQSVKAVPNKHFFKIVEP
jgi:hypothetical protein